MTMLENGNQWGYGRGPYYRMVISRAMGEGHCYRMVISRAMGEGHVTEW